ncbi:regulator of G protein signaling domain family protein [Aspergillus niger]|nr:regulator of G protein signaling domain family protein [Aspergillus niger]
MFPILSDLYKQTTQIQYFDSYGIWIAILLGVWLIARLAHRLGRWTVQRPIATIDISTAFEVILVGVLLGANIVLLLVSAHGWADVQQRAAKLAVLNLLPLGTGLTFGLPAHLLGISRSAVLWSLPV